MNSTSSALVALTFGALVTLLTGPPITPRLHAATPVQSGLGCSATFSDRSGDAIVSDGAGAYVNGVAGVSCEVFEGASDDITLYLTASKHASRFIEFNYTDRISASGPTGILDDLSTLSSLQDVAALAVGMAGSKTGGFTTAVGRFAFNPSNWPGSSELTATRISQTEWTISADAAVNDVAVLSQASHKGSVAVGEYHMPFELTVSCPTCQ